MARTSASSQNVGMGMQPVDSDQQAGFAAALCGQLRESRRRQGLTQAQVATRTGGQVSKAALANYETGHRSLRVDVFWVLARALDEDCGALIAGAERAIVPSSSLRSRSTISIRVSDVLATTDVALAPVRRWFSIRHPDGAVDNVTESLGEGALQALASLMGITLTECRDRLIDLALPAVITPLPSQIDRGSSTTFAGTS